MRTQPDSQEKKKVFMTLRLAFLAQNMDMFSEEALNTVQPTLRNKIGTKFMFSLKVSEGLENDFVFDTNLSFSAHRAEFPVSFSRCFCCS